jgi:hypothetical protein
MTKKKQPARKKTQPSQKSEPGFFQAIRGGWREAKEQSLKEE